MLLHKVLQDLDPHVWVVNLGEKKKNPFIQSKAAYFMNSVETVGGKQGKMWFQDVAKKKKKKIILLLHSQI